MKKFTIATTIFILLFSGLQAQVPLGMQYQAVARDLQGKILPNQEIALRINLVGDERSAKIYYSELHKVTTNMLGLFTMVIGGGSPEKGSFDAVPWSTENIWMQVAIKDKGKNDFAVISNSKLLAVPYAFHAGTANRLTNYASRDAINTSGINSLPNSSISTATTSTTTSGVPSNSWLLFGNSSSDSTTAKLGTTDYAALRLFTNNIERLHINANGNMDIKRSLSIGANLNVDSSATLNTKNGTTLNYGPFTVGTAFRRSPTMLAGTLTVDLATDLNSSLNVDGPTDLNSRLNVNNGSPTQLSGTLQVDGITNLNSALNVNNASPTVLTGTLRTDDDAVFKKHVRLDNPSAADDYKSVSTTTGALVVTGGLGLGKNLNVGGDANFGGHTTFAGAVAITDGTESTNTTSGALTVTGGVGIGKRLNVGGATQLNSTLGVTGATTLSNTLGVTGATTLSSTLGVTGATTMGNTLEVTGATALKSTLGVDGITTVNNTTESTSSSTGALKVTGGAGIAKNVNVGGNLTTTGVTTVNNTLKVNAATDYIAEFTNTTDANGIAIKINTGQSRNDNHFVTFKNGAGNVVGRIQGETQSEMEDDLDYQLDLTSKTYDVVSGAIDVSLATIDLAEQIAFQIEADASVNACAGLGVVACPPIASFVAGSIATVVAAGVEEAAVIAEVAVASTDLGRWVQMKKDDIGVTYQSGAGDYAEYLMKQQPAEKIFPGDIVGVKGGKISKDITGAEKIMVVSYKPIVLGNTPSDFTESNYEKVAFMGQVPVKVVGTVHLGDYIIPNGLNNGVGIAVSPDKIDPKDVKNIVGIAWSASNTAMGLSNINVAIGLNVNDNQKIIDQQQNQIDELKNQIAQTNAQLEKLIPGFKASAGYVTSNPAAATYTAGTGVFKNTARIATTDPYPSIKGTTLSYPVMNANQVEYVNITKADFVNGFDLAEERMKANGSISKLQNFWKKFHSDARYKDDVINNIMNQYRIQLENHKNLDKKLNH